MHLENSLKWIFSSLSAFTHVLLGGWSPCCRFTPSCSQYGANAIVQHGPIKGAWLFFRRVLRCRPTAEWGWDPVPTRHPGGRHEF